MGHRASGAILKSEHERVLHRLPSKPLQDAEVCAGSGRPGMNRTPQCLIKCLIKCLIHGAPHKRCDTEERARASSSEASQAAQGWLPWTGRVYPQRTAPGLAHREPPERWKMRSTPERVTSSAFSARGEFAIAANRLAHVCRRTAH